LVVGISVVGISVVGISVVDISVVGISAHHEANDCSQVNQLYNIVADDLPSNLPRIDSGLQAHHVELDMTSSDDLVEFRDALARREELAVDHFEIMEGKSRQWWRAMNE